MKAFVDTETCGLTPDYCSLLEIAAILVDDDNKVIDTFHEYIRPDSPIPAKITEITRITNEQVKYCRNEKAVVGSFSDWLIGNGVDTLIAHNAPFDMKFLKGRTNRYDIPNKYSSINVIDTLAMTRSLIKTGKLTINEKTPTGRVSTKQESIARALGIEYGAGGAHSAIEDVTVLMKIYGAFEKLMR